MAFIRGLFSSRELEGTPLEVFAKDWGITQRIDLRLDVEDLARRSGQSEEQVVKDICRLFFHYFPLDTSFKLHEEMVPSHLVALKKK